MLRVKIGIVMAVMLAVFCLPSLAQNNADNPAQTQTVAPGQRDGLRIFLCGHSFHTFIWLPLWELAVADGFKPPQRWWPQFIGGSTVLQHWNVPDETNEVKKRLLQGDIDVLTMAPGPFPDEGIDKFVKLGLEHNPNMRFTVQLSWGGYDGDNQIAKAPPATVDREKTPEQLQALAEPNIKAGEAQIDRLNKEIGRQVVFLVPMAQAVVALRTKIYHKQMPGLDSQAQLFSDLIGHPSPPLQALNTYVHYAVIYRRSPVDLPMVGGLKYAKSEVWNDQFNRALEELAWETVIHYTYSGVTAAPPETTPEPPK